MIFSAIRWLCACKTAQAVTVSTLIPSSTRDMIRSMMYTYGAYGAQMTGSGSAVVGIYDSFEYATVACTMLKDKYSEIFLAKTV